MLHNWIDAARAPIHSEAVGVTSRRKTAMQVAATSPKQRLQETFAKRSFRKDVYGMATSWAKRARSAERKSFVGNSGKPVSPAGAL